MAASLSALVGNGIGAGLGLFQTLHSNKMYKKGLDIYNSTPFPEYQHPEEIDENKAIATREAQEGMPAEQYQQGLNQIGRNQTFGLNALQSRGGSVGDINALVGESNNAALGLASTSAQMRNANQGVLMQANQSLAGYKDKEYQVNKLQRYLMRLGMASSMMKSGNEGFNQGLNMIGNSLAQGAQNAGDVAQNGGFSSAFSQLFGAVATGA